MALYDEPAFESDGGEDMLERMLFHELRESSVRVRVSCTRCDGSGQKNGDICEVCNGEKFVTQLMSLYSVGKKLFPLFIHLMRTAAEQQQQAAGARS